MTAAAGMLAALLAPSRCILLDFDGPVCGLFRGQLTGAAVVERLATVVIDTGLCPPDRIPQTDDALEVLRLAYQIAPVLARRVEAVLTQAEMEAAATAPQTPDAAEFIRAVVNSGRKLAIVSNNSSAAIKSYLSAHELAIDVIIGRANGDPARMKPSPYLLQKAMTTFVTESSQCTLIGDSTSDIAAARCVNMASIGYANTNAKVLALTDAGADSVVADMHTLTMSLTSRED